MVLLQASAICVVRYLPFKRCTEVFGVVDSHLVFDKASVLKAAGDFRKVGRLLLQASPAPLDKDLVEITPLSSIGMRTSAFVNVVTQADHLNWLP